MKIIGHTSLGYICEVSPDELLKINGGKHATGLGERCFLDGYRAKIGSVIEVDKAWERVEQIQQKEAAMKEKAQALRSLANILESLPVIIREPNEETKVQA